MNTSSGEHPVAGAASDHASPRSPIRHALSSGGPDSYRFAFLAGSALRSAPAAGL